MLTLDPPGKYLLTEQSEIVLENKLSELRLMLDLSDLCGLLCCAAPTEDKYGVVQLVLPEVLNTVTTTLKAVDQVGLMPHATPLFSYFSVMIH